MNWFTKRKLKNKKNYDLYETQCDIAYIKMSKAHLLSCDEVKERETLATLKEKIANNRELIKNAKDKEKISEHLDDLMVQAKDQEDLVNDMVLWRSHLKKLLDAEKELKRYISML